MRVTPLENNISYRPANRSDLYQLNQLINYEIHVHRHLDWRPVQEWLGQKPFWIAERNERAIATICFPPDPETIYWIRLFACSALYEASSLFKSLFTIALEEETLSKQEIISALALQPWFEEVLTGAGFSHYQDIVVLEWKNPSLSALPSNDHVWVRVMVPSDLPKVLDVDIAAFEPLWSMSEDSIHRAFYQAAYAAVVEVNHEIAGYQICTGTLTSAHLARLAIDPAHQGEHLAHALLWDMLEHFRHTRVNQITVNTQSNNQASLTLYKRIGFEFTGESIPVYMYQSA